VNAHLAIALGVAAWGAVFLFLLVSIAIAADVERRWDENWVMNWEERNHGSIDVLLDRLSNQAAKWRLGRRLLNIYIGAGVLGLALLAFLQYKDWAMTAASFREVMLLGLAPIGLVLLPVRVACEIGLSLIDGMRRQARKVTGERIVVEAESEVSEIPKPAKGKPKAGAEKEQSAK
jgi:hypothetical protein